MKWAAVFFDLDGTLYDSKAYNRANIGIVIKHWRLFLAYRQVRRYWHAHRCEGSLVQQQEQMLAQQAHISLKKAQWFIQHIVHGKLNTILPQLGPVPGVVELLSALKDKGIFLGVLSDFPIGQKLEQLQLNQFWDLQISTEDFNALKPYPDGFLALLKQSGMAPQQCLYVGNSYAYDMVGAKQQGLATAWFTQAKQVRKPSKNRQAFVDFYFDHYRQLRQILLR